MKALIILSIALLAACGGGGDDGPTKIVGTSSVQGGSDVSAASLLTARLVGPEVTTASPSRVSVCISGAWVQKVHFGATLTWGIQIAGDTAVTVNSSRISATMPLTLAHCGSLTLPAGASMLYAFVTVRATDGRHALAALASYSAQAEWVVEPL